jgi:hypothetical protein
MIIDMIGEELKDDPIAPDYSNYISPVLATLANCTYYLFVPADGSKEGWETSNNMDEVREKIRAYVIKHNAKSKDRIDIILVTDDEGTGLHVDRVVRAYGDED